jgi:hypothetical protein
VNTHSLCPVCYRHVAATVFESGGVIRMEKSCPVHGAFDVVVENNADFYRRIINSRGRFVEPQDMIVLDVTDKCNLSCAHCYHIPDNQSENKPIASVMADVALTPERFSILLGGAEPTIRKDLLELVQEVKRSDRPVGMLSNGVRFAEKAFAKRIAPLLDGIVLIGLNHESYQGKKIHAKQLKGLQYLSEFGVRPMVGYTADHEQLSDILTEALALFSDNRLAMVRLRFGANIGRHPDLKPHTLSDHIRELARVCDTMGLACEMLLEADNSIYHQMMRVAGMPVRVIQWPDEHNMVLNQLTRAPWAKFIDGPISNFCHQIVLRDGFINKGISAPDAIPPQYTLAAATRPPLDQVQETRSAPTATGPGVPQYVEYISDIAVANFHGRLDTGQRDTLAKFWIESGAIQDAHEARRRTDEVVHVAIDKNGHTVAVNTCYTAMLDTGSGPQPYWFYRQFVHPRARSVRLSLALVRLTVAYLAKAFQGKSAPRGIAMILENNKFYGRAGRRALMWLEMRLAARLPGGKEVWTRDFMPALQAATHSNDMEPIGQ